jgi:hypothetical protein
VGYHRATKLSSPSAKFPFDLIHTAMTSSEGNPPRASSTVPSMSSTIDLSEGPRALRCLTERVR